MWIATNPFPLNRELKTTTSWILSGLSPLHISPTIKASATLPLYSPWSIFSSACGPAAGSTDSWEILEEFLGGRISRKGFPTPRFWYITFEGLSQNEFQYQCSALQHRALLETFCITLAKLMPRWTRWGRAIQRRDELMAAIPEVHFSTITAFV